MLDHRQKYALEMAVFELVNAIHYGYLRGTL